MEKFWNIIHFFAYKLMNKWFMPSKILIPYKKLPLYIEITFLSTQNSLL